MIQIKKTPTIFAISLAASSFVTQAADSNGPNFYGKLYISMDLQKSEKKADTTNSEPSHWALNSRSSRIGIKQDIPLNDKITAFYKGEMSVEVDDGDKGGKSFGQRDIYVGIKGNLGAVQAGRFSTPFRKTEGKIELFSLLDGEIDEVLGAQSRVSNIIQYSTPTLANTVVSVSFQPNEEDGKEPLKNAYSASAVYNKDNLYAAIGLGKNILSEKITTDITPAQQSDRIQLAAKYQMGAASFGAIFHHAQDANDHSLKENAFVINSSYRINDYTLKAQYGLNKGKVTKNERSLAAVGVDYSLSKASFIGLNYIVVTDEQGSTKDITDKTLTFAYSLSF